MYELAALSLDYKKIVFRLTPSFTTKAETGMLREKWLENFNKELKSTVMKYLSEDKGYTETKSTWQKALSEHDYKDRYLYPLEAGGKRLRPMIVQLVAGAL